MREITLQLPDSFDIVCTHRGYGISVPVSLSTETVSEYQIKMGIVECARRGVAAKQIRKVSGTELRRLSHEGIKDELECYLPVGRYVPEHKKHWREEVNDLAHDQKIALLQELQTELANDDVGIEVDDTPEVETK